MSLLKTFLIQRTDFYIGAIDFLYVYGEFDVISTNDGFTTNRNYERYYQIYIFFIFNKYS